MATLNVKTEYGAHGDGVTDDTDHINSAIAAAASGDVIYFPEGTYPASAGVTCVTGRSFLGDGPDKSWIKGGLRWQAHVNLTDIAIGTDTQGTAEATP